MRTQFNGGSWTVPKRSDSTHTAHNATVVHSGMWLGPEILMYPATRSAPAIIALQPGRGVLKGIHAIENPNHCNSKHLKCYGCEQYKNVNLSRVDQDEASI